MEQEEPKTKKDRRAAPKAAAHEAELDAVGQARQRALGRLEPPRGTSKRLQVLKGVAYSRGGEGAAYTTYRVLPGFAPSTAVPHRNPKRNLRRAFGKMSGRQWNRLRRAINRSAA